MSRETSLNIFFSYSHRDEGLRQELENHLSMLKRQEAIRTWYDGQIRPGQEWDPAISRNLEAADVILLLISPDFIASDFCWSREMKKALARHEAGEGQVIPIIVRPVDDWQSAPFGKLQALPKGGEAVSVWSDRDLALQNVAAGIRGAVDEQLRRPASASTPTNEGIASGTPDLKEAEIRVYDDLVSRFGDRQEPAIVEEVADALLDKCWALRQSNRGEEALEVYDDLVFRYGDQQEAAIAWKVAKALRSKGWTLRKLGRKDHALKVFDDLTLRYGDRQETTIAGEVACALRSRGWILHELGRNDEALKVFDDLILRYGDRQETTIAGEVACALRGRGRTLKTLGRNEEAIETYNDLISRYGDRQEAAIIEEAVAALRSKGLTLRELGRIEEALEVFDDLILRYGDRQEPAIAEELAKALRNKGWTLRKLSRRKIEES